MTLQVLNRLTLAFAAARSARILMRERILGWAMGRIKWGEGIQLGSKLNCDGWWIIFNMMGGG